MQKCVFPNEYLLLGHLFIIKQGFCFGEHFETSLLYLCYVSPFALINTAFMIELQLNKF